MPGMLALHLAAGSARDLVRMIVMKPKGIDFPADRVREAFGLPPVDRRAQRNEAPPPGSVLH